MPAKSPLRLLSSLLRVAIVIAGLAHAATPPALITPVPLTPQALLALRDLVADWADEATSGACAALDAQGGAGRQLLVWLLPGAPVLTWCAPTEAPAP